VNVLIWHVHGSWTTNFVQGPHRYLVPVVPDRGPDGRGRARTWDWPEQVVEIAPHELAEVAIDVVIVQRPRELELLRRWCPDRAIGRDVPLVWLEHNAPQGRIAEMRHPARDRDDVTIVHVTHTNALMWDTGSARAVVIDHGVLDPGARWTGDDPASAVVVNEPVRRGRVVGTDLLARFGKRGPVDVFGIGTSDLIGHLGDPPWLGVHDDVPQEQLHRLLSQRRCYVHPFRWTSLGLSLIEAMLMAMPVVALATTEVPDAVPPDCGVVSNDVDVLVDAVDRLRRDDELATRLGGNARRHALERFSLDRFLERWNQLLEVITA
jgi:hypothetical protein